MKEELQEKLKSEYIRIGSRYIARTTLLLAAAAAIVAVTLFVAVVLPRLKGGDEEDALYVNSAALAEASGHVKVYDLAGGLVYEGEVSAGIPEGEGRLFAADGSQIYSGQWQAGAFCGQGSLYQSGKLVYEGEFLNNLYSGQGTLYDTDGRVHYEGMFTEGEKNGWGLLYGDSGVPLYEGFFRKGEIDWLSLLGADYEAACQSFRTRPTVSHLYEGSEHEAAETAETAWLTEATALRGEAEMMTLWSETAPEQEPDSGSQKADQQEGSPHGEEQEQEPGQGLTGPQNQKQDKDEDQDQNETGPNMDSLEGDQSQPGEEAAWSPQVQDEDQTLPLQDQPEPLQEQSSLSPVYMIVGWEQMDAKLVFSVEEGMPQFVEFICMWGEETPFIGDEAAVWGDIQEAPDWLREVIAAEPFEADGVDRVLKLYRKIWVGSLDYVQISSWESQDGEHLLYTLEYAEDLTGKEKKGK